MSESAPDLTRKVIGWRAWRMLPAGMYPLSAFDPPPAQFEEGWRLGPVGCTSAPAWHPGANRALCYRHTFGFLRYADTLNEVDHQAPWTECGCGLYAWHTPLMIDGSVRSGDLAAGLVAAWGRVCVHNDGFRAEWAEPVALVLPSDAERVWARRLARVAAHYKVPLVPEVDIFAPGFADSLGAPVPNSLRPAPSPGETVVMPGATVTINGVGLVANTGSGPVTVQTSAGFRAAAAAAPPTPPAPQQLKKLGRSAKEAGDALANATEALGKAQAKHEHKRSPKWWRKRKDRW